jgi:hypothetical protein
MRVLDSRLHKAQQALAKHKKALLQSLEKPLRELGYRLVPLPDNGPTVSAPGGTPTSWEPSAPADSLICPDCDRTFALPVHLGRHRHAMHPNR